jgi:hypothetical protein
VIQRAKAAEAKLAAAEALLGRVKARENDIWDEGLVADITAHLAGAAAPAREDYTCPSCGDGMVCTTAVRSEAEQRVLDALIEVPYHWLSKHADSPHRDVREMVAAELTRRGLKP